MRSIVKKVDSTAPPNPGLRVEVSVEPEMNESYKMLGYNLSLRLAQVEIGTRFRPVTHDLNPGNQLKITETFPITPLLLHAIESQRAGGDVSVEAAVTILGVSSPGNTTAAHQFHAFGLGSQDPAFELPQSKWSKLREGMGAGRYEVLEILVPPSPFPVGFQPVVALLEAAHASLAEGKTDDVVSKCRKALETLNPIVSVQQNASAGPPFQRLEPGIASKADLGSSGQSGYSSKSERIEKYRQAVWEMLHIGPHSGYQVFPEDARAIFWFTAGLVRYYADLVARP